MILDRITLQGFLCYGDVQEIDLADLSLCMLSGPNGSGKSSVFDAVSFALFGAHRGGKIGHETLINHAHDGAVIECEFRISGKRWKVRRSVRRGRNMAVQLSQWDEADSAWKVTPDTSGRSGFDQWIRDNVGLSHEAFVCSMLLRQGDADRLLSAQPKERFQVLAGVVDLERYQRLAAKADDRRRGTESKCKVVEGQLGAIPEISVEQLRQAQQETVEAEATAKSQESEIERLRGIEAQVQRWAALEGRLVQARARLDQHQGLLSRRAKIESGVQRLGELRTSIPHVERMLDLRSKADVGRQKITALTADHAIKERQVVALAAKSDAERQAWQAAKEQATETERLERVAQARVSELAVLLAAQEAFEQQRISLEEVRRELAKLPADPSADLKLATEQHGQIAMLNAALPALKRLAEHRAELRLRHTAIGKTREKLQTASVELRALESERVKVEAEEEEIHRKLQTSRDRAARAKAHVDVATSAADKLVQAKGQAECPACGLPLTAAHLVEEEGRRREQVKVAKATLQTVGQEVTVLEKDLKRVRSLVSDAETSLGKAQETERKLASQSQELGRDLKTLHRECSRAYEELSPAFRERVSAEAVDDWTMTAWPIDSDLETMKAEIAQLPSMQRDLGKAQELFQQWKDLTAREQALASASTQQNAQLLSNAVVLRDEHAVSVRQHQKLAKSLKEQRTKAEAADKLTRSLEQDQLKMQRELDGVAGLLNQEKFRLEGMNAQLGDSQAQLSDQWQIIAASATTKHVTQWRREIKDLETAGVEVDQKHLDAAMAEAVSAEGVVRELEAEASQVPEAARQEPRVVARQLETSREKQRQCQKSVQDAQLRMASLAEQAKRREALKSEYLEADEKHSHFKLLAELLGRDGLQLHLLRQAERGILGHANTILDNLSGGDLRLQSRNTADGDPADHAFDLDVMNGRTGATHPVEFLSGSERFRVAISLALAIGQYASGGRRCGETVMIDEGFGSLDGDNQRVMIDELHNLKGLLKRIILVSHQESFAAAFPDGYRFAVDESGETRIVRLGGS